MCELSGAANVLCHPGETWKGGSAEGVVSCLGLKDLLGFTSLSTYSILVQMVRQDSERSFVHCVASMSSSRITGGDQGGMIYLSASPSSAEGGMRAKPAVPPSPTSMPLPSHLFHRLCFKARTPVRLITKKSGDSVTKS